MKKENTKVESKNVAKKISKAKYPNQYTPERGKKHRQNLYIYRKKCLKRVPLDLQKEFYEVVKKKADESEESVNGYIKTAIIQRMYPDGNIPEFTSRRGNTKTRIDKDAVE